MSDIKLENFCSFGLTSSEVLEELYFWFKGTADELSGYDSDYIQTHIEDQEHSFPDKSKLEIYFEVESWVVNDLNEFVYESRNLLNYLPLNSKKISEFFKDSPVLAIIIEGITIFETIVQKGIQTLDESARILGYQDFDEKDVKEVFGEKAIRFKKTVEEIKPKDYELAFEEITCYLEFLGESGFEIRLRDLATKLLVYKKYFCDILEKSETNTNASGRIVTLLQFMQRYCEGQKISLLKYRRKSLNDAHFREAITLPEHIKPWRSGQSKKYKVDELKAQWRNYQEINPNLPSLKQKSKKANLKATQSD